MRRSLALRNPVAVAAAVDMAAVAAAGAVAVVAAAAVAVAVDMAAVAAAGAAVAADTAVAAAPVTDEATESLSFIEQVSRPRLTPNGRVLPRLEMQ